LPPSDQLSSLLGSLTELAQALKEHTKVVDQQNDLLTQVVAQNADLIALLTDEDKDKGEEEYDLRGKRVA
jgi:hypothetical protein